MPSSKKDPCKKFACRIQSCLEKHKYQESRCLEELEDMRQCCLKWHKESLCCSGIILDKDYLDRSENLKAKSQ
ncbi:cx9C motif-containing protein 4 [Condylostylus longicornis]|uniref:cx9C motif-containing protein 4 n=1 Tax=Condylostylus longicornis TaxID=2530218 RepID=UPI00244DEE8C|nr:cx9C motif-containing protein 4 [Condylostylus longicornis]